MAQINAFLQERVTGLAIVQLFRREEQSRREFAEINEEHRRAQLRSIFYYALFYPLVEIGAPGRAHPLVRGVRSSRAR